MDNKKIIVGIIFLSLFLFSLYYFVVLDRQNAQQIATEQIDNYPLLKDIKKKSLINGVILRKNLSLNRYNKGSYMIELSNGVRFALYETSRNYEYEPEPDLNRFIKEGDSISVRVKNDSIFVYRESHEYYFVLGKIINKKE
ncbi:hypothetical protein [Prevotella sp. 10(H)]|uniref:hypothetical protein n=1 Tax=Prevotella sp. 10(H) TaxID=1158294 RepID=UPI0004A6DD39|nr:hypothetical protein [Prevotella sp. 10(H)]